MLDPKAFRRTLQAAGDAWEVNSGPHQSVNKLSVKSTVAFAIVVPVVGALFFAWRGNRIDFSDNPALLVRVSEVGQVTLDTHQGTVVARLAHVNWRTNSSRLADVKNAIAAAQRDKVVFRKTESGELLIWYDTESGPENLNRKLNAIFEENIPSSPRR